MSTIYDDKRFFDEYATMYRSTHGLDGAGEWYRFRELLPDFAGKRVLDLGCGYGWHCRYAAENGASEVLGIDLSERMLKRADEINSHENITYRHMGICEFDYPVEYYDVAISNLALHYIEDLDTVYKNIFNTLRPGGCFVFNIEHPTFTAGVNQEWITDGSGNVKYWPVDNYYYPGERITVFLGMKVVKYHHTLTQIIMGLINCGFNIRCMEEIGPHPDTLGIPGMADEMRRPMMLVVKAEKSI
ncbi:MAG: class I SAM-dependent methyltransferase [Anaerofustis stercorihominis]|nr:class I SAM-dependent methyltransferase [Anaerofustis stercorihominis]